MKVTLNIKKRVCTVKREDNDPKFNDSEWGSGESRLLYHVKNILNAKGYDLIKKRMCKDGHMVSEDQLYLRSRNLKSKKPIAIFNSFWQVRGANECFNEHGSVEFDVEPLD